YQRRLARLLNVLRATQDNYLYRDELAWLYNEMALVSFSQGLLPDATALYQATREQSARVETSLGIRCAEADLGLGLVWLERGHLRRASHYIESAMRIASRSGARGLGTSATSLQLRDRIKGHLGLVRHLLGDYDKAKELYVAALSNIGNLRGASVF